MNRYLLPCSCGHRIAVGPGQAGGEVACPSCGAAVAVPRLGMLARLDAAASDEAGAAGRGWGVAQAWLLAGVAVAVVGLAVASWLRVQRAGFVRFDEAAVMKMVASSPTDMVHAAWLRFEQEGILKEPLPEERRRQEQEAMLAALETCAWVVAAVGAAVVAAAAVPACRIRPRRGGPA